MTAHELAKRLLEQPDTQLIIAISMHEECNLEIGIDDPQDVYIEQLEGKSQVNITHGTLQLIDYLRGDKKLVESWGLDYLWENNLDPQFGPQERS